MDSDGQRYVPLICCSGDIAVRCNGSSLLTVAEDSFKVVCIKGSAAGW